MKTDFFDYNLPRKFIAQSPMVPRDHSKLLVFDTSLNKIYHKKFFDIVDFLNTGDSLVLNKAKVFPARINFSLNGSNKEIFILKRLSDFCFRVLVRPGKFFKLNKKISISADLLFVVKEILDDGSRIIEFDSFNIDDFNLALNSISKIPLPPYIEDNSNFYPNYHTVYSDQSFSESVAAPTAGLHFTNDLLANLVNKGISINEVVLHVGRGTFLPVSSENIKDHIMHSEEFIMPGDVANSLNLLDRSKSRIIAVGTTSVRVLESNFNKYSSFKADVDDTNIFIYPGSYTFRAVDALITNFHLPKSTLLMLVASFLENKGLNNPIEKVLELYEIAKENDYRFYSFGDSMFIF